MDIPAADTRELTEPNPPVGLVAGLGKLYRDVWEYRHLVANFVQRDLRVKYRNSALGYFWSLLEPMLQSGIYIVLFTILAGKPQREYPLWVILGVLTWGCFARSVSKGVISITGNESKIKAIFFPRALFAISTTLSQVAMTALNLLVAVPFMIYFGMSPTLQLLWVPFGLLLVALFSAGISLGFSCMNVVNRDVEHFFKFVVRAGLYISPVLFTLDMIPKSRSAAVEYILLNPMSVPITLVRNGFTGQPFPVDVGYLVYAIAACVGTFVVGAMVFQRCEAGVIKKI